MPSEIVKWFIGTLSVDTSTFRNSDFCSEQFDEITAFARHRHLHRFGSQRPHELALAWWDAGHMQIAYVAYRKLDTPVKDKVDALLRLKPDYGNWTTGIADPKTARLHAFVHAATLADDIKTKGYNYTRDEVDSPTAGQNIGYADKNQHAY